MDLAHQPGDRPLRVSEPGKMLPPVVHDHRHAAFGATGRRPRRGPRRRGPERAVHRVQLDRDGAEGRAGRAASAAGVGVQPPGSRWPPGGTGPGCARSAAAGPRPAGSPVVRGLYSANSRRGTPDAPRPPAWRRAGPGTGSPSGAETRSASRSPCRKSAAHCIQAGDTVLSRGTCMWASVTAMPSIMTITADRDVRRPGPVDAGRTRCRSAPTPRCSRPAPRSS